MSQPNKILALFPGQGSQKVGMGKDLCEHELARDLFARADAALGFSLSQICFEGPTERLTATEIAQPAILTVSTICFELAKWKMGSALDVVAAAGHSLGEYSALVAAGALSFEDAVKLVNKRGRYMQSAVPEKVGKMIAVLGKEVAEVEAVLKKVDRGPAEIANINAPGQIVVSGKREAVDQFIELLGNSKTIELAVSAPFHCSLMQPAADALAKDLASAKISAAKFPVYANVTAGPVVQPDEIRTALENQVCGKVRWVESMQSAIAAMKPTIAIEFGTGNVLSGLLKRIDSSIPRASCDSLTTADKLQELSQAA